MFLLRTTLEHLPCYVNTKSEREIQKHTGTYISTHTHTHTHARTHARTQIHIYTENIVPSPLRSISYLFSYSIKKFSMKIKKTKDKQRNYFNSAVESNLLSVENCIYLFYLLNYNILQWLRM